MIKRPICDLRFTHANVCSEEEDLFECDEARKATTDSVSNSDAMGIGLGMDASLISVCVATRNTAHAAG